MLRVSKICFGFVLAAFFSLNSFVYAESTSSKTSVTSANYDDFIASLRTNKTSTPKTNTTFTSEGMSSQDISSQASSEMDSFLVETEASTTGIPKIVLAGLKAYQAQGAETAIKEWIKGGPVENDAATAKASGTFHQIESFYGSYIGYDLITIESITPKIKIVYIAMNFEKGPIFCQFPCYKRGSDWIITGKFNFNTEPSQVLPEHLFKKGSL